jgi:VanZ family protein
MESAAGLLTRGSPFAAFPALRPVASRDGRLPSQRRDRPGLAPGSLTVSLVEPEPIIARMRQPLSRWLPVVLWAAVIFAFSSVPDLGTGLGTWDFVLRKLAHAAEFAILGALLLRALTRPWTSFALGVVYAISDEGHQHFVEGRQGSPRDVLIDAVGVALGVIAWRRLGPARAPRQGSIRNGR